MARSPGKRPDARVIPPDHKQLRTLWSGGPALHDRETIVWAFSIVDQDGPWGWRTAAAPAWWGEILPKLQDFESMTWSEIMKAAGGRARGNNSHFVQVDTAGHAQWYRIRSAKDSNNERWRDLARLS